MRGLQWLLAAGVVRAADRMPTLVRNSPPAKHSARPASESQMHYNTRYHSREPGHQDTCTRAQGATVIGLLAIFPVCSYSPVLARSSSTACVMNCKKPPPAVLSCAGVYHDKMRRFLPSSRAPAVDDIPTCQHHTALTLTLEEGHFNIYSKKAKCLLCYVDMKYQTVSQNHIQHSEYF